jgi:D-amino-acid dehydrogenase
VNVVVVGGGAVGLASAVSLMRAGADVTVVERDLCGGATSLGNAGWVTPMLSTPLPEPGVMRQALRWMLDPKSPLFVRPRLDPSFLAWSWRFVRNCTPSQFEQGSRALLGLNAQTLALFDDLRDAGVEFEMHEVGVMAVALSEEVLLKEWKLLRGLAELGYPGRLELLEGDDARREEPALTAAVVGGVRAADERHIRPETFTGGLRRWLEAAGAEIRERTAVRSLVRDGSGWRVETSGETLAADRVVVAAGIWSRELLRPLGTTLPLEAAKGYSITLRTNGPAPRHALMLQEAKVGVSPFEGSLRLAGTLELAGMNLRLSRRRVGAIAAAGARYLTGFRLDGSETSWAGLRQFLPDGLPAIGRVPTADGVFVATGHGMLGITLAPATAHALTPLVLEGRLVPELEPLQVDRRY